MKSKLIKAVIAGVVAVAVGFGGFYGYNKYLGNKTVVTAAQVVTANVRKMNLQSTIQGTGSAYAAVVKEVAPNNNGTLKDLSLKIGDTVTAGQKLYVSDSDTLRSAVTDAQNNLSQQKLTLASDQSSENPDATKIAKDNIAISDAKTKLTAANLQVTNMTVKSPISGVITAVNNSNGDSIQSGKSVLTVVDMTSIKVKVSVDELDIAKIKIGQKADIKFDAIKNKAYEGVVEAIAETGTTTNNVTTYEVVVAITDPSGIKLGMNANVSILIESKENALVIPAEALVENNGKKYVRLASSDTSGVNSQTGTTNANLTEIKTGLETESYIEVTEGLKEGDKVQIKVVQSSTSSNSNNKNNQLGGFGAEMGGAPPQDRNMGAPASQGGSSSGSKN